jgi:hypothetical protein
MSAKSYYIVTHISMNISFNYTIDIKYFTIFLLWQNSLILRNNLQL